MAITQNITDLYAGDDARIIMTVQGSGSIADWKIGFDFYDYHRVLVFALSSEGASPAITITNPDNRIVLIDLSGKLNIAPATYRYVIRKINSGSAARLAYGTFSLRR